MPVIDPIHPRAEQRSDACWTLVNIGEAYPGTLSPLAWTFIADTQERGVRRAFGQLGVLPAKLVPLPSDDRLDGRFTAVFHGRAAANVEAMRMAMDNAPGLSGDQFEESVFGSVRPGVKGTPDRRRYPLVVLRLPLRLRDVPGRIATLRDETDTWWRRSIPELTRIDEDTLRTRFADAQRRFEAILEPNTLVGLLGGIFYGLGAELCAKQGRADLTSSFLAGFPSIEEGAVVEHLVAVAEGRESLDRFVELHGFHGPAEGDLRSRTWREDRGGLADVVAGYRGLAASERPAARQAACQAAHRDAVDALCAAAGRQAWLIRMVDRLLGRWVPLREVSKAAYLQAIDVGRGSARELGLRLHARGVIASADDIFMLTADELVGGDVPPQVVLDDRRRRWTNHADLELPEGWVGMPEPEIRAVSADEVVDRLRGVPASPGLFEGRARVVLDPRTAEIESGEVLVCRTTDPSWVPLMVLAGGIVSDVGGVMSHAAIVAREFGVPAVLGTKRGTREIHTGDHVRLDGATGEVTILARTPSGLVPVPVPVQPPGSHVDAHRPQPPDRARLDHAGGG
jgi:phosphohistidine swiveling domain-containing protein